MKPNNVRVRWSRWRWAALPLLTLLGGCSGPPECSDARVLDTVLRLAPQQFAQLREWFAFDAQKNHYSVGSIRTAATEKQARSCKAQLVVKLELIDMLQSIKGQNEAWGYALLTTPHITDTEARFDISYRAENTDDGRDVYITLEPLK